MYETIKTVINGGDYVLHELLEKINFFFAKGSLTKDEYNDLMELSRTNASARKEADLFAKVKELEKRIKALEKNANTSNSTEAVEEYKDGHWYYRGDKCLWNGEAYLCVAPEGIVCVWSPEGYPSYWTKEDVT